jgi:hypothetical protein
MRGGVTFLNYITVGTDHKLQNSDSRDTGLKDLLSAILQHNDVALIAEEVETSKPVNTFGRELVGEDRWLSIDMNDEERKKEGIYNTLLHSGAPLRDPRTGFDVPANYYHQISEGNRENHWLNKIEQWCRENGGIDETVLPIHKTVVLVCGHNHLPFVGAKISERGHSVIQLEYLTYNKEQAQGLFTIFND